MSTTFRLVTLERLRTKDLEDASRQLGMATSALGEARDRLATIDDALAGRGPDRATPGELTLQGTYRDRLRADRLDALEDVSRAEGELVRARQDWITARAALKAVATLHERHREKVKAERARKEQVEMDDLAGMRHRAKHDHDIPQPRIAADDRTGDDHESAPYGAAEGWQR